VSTINERDVFVNNSVVEFSSVFNNPDMINKALERAKADELYAGALKKIDEDDVSGAFDLLMEANSYRNELDKPAVQRLIRRKLCRLTRYRQENDELKSRLEADKEKFRKLASEYVAMGKECAAEGMEPTPIFANYNKAIDLYPESVDAWLGKAEACKSVGDTAEAIKCYKQVYELAENNFDASYGLGKLYFDNDDLAESLNWYLIALKINENSVNLHLSLAELYKKVGDKKAASRHNAMAEKLRKRGKRK
jgi:tetratricopeptide (TPR) repeat protein